MSLPLFSLENKVAFITGATNGIGRGMAEGLALGGISQIIISHRPSTNPNSTINHLKSFNPSLQVDSIEADLGLIKLKDIEAGLYVKVIEKSVTGRVDILINNAGISYRNAFESFPDDEFDEVLYVNMRVPAKLAQLFGKHMLENKIKGKMIFTASLMSYQGGLRVAPYAISKGGIKLFVQALSNEWSEHAICVNAIAPGYVETNMTEALKSDKKRYAEISGRIPLGRWATPEDFRGPTLFLASSASDYITGETLAVDGGWLGR